MWFKELVVTWMLSDQVFITVCPTVATVSTVATVPTVATAAVLLWQL